MNPYLLGGIGAAIGLASSAIAGSGVTVRLENIAVAIFGAFTGSAIATKALGIPETATTALGGALAVVGAISMLVLLALLRRVVGPLKPHRRKGDRS